MKGYFLQDYYQAGWVPTVEAYLSTRYLSVENRILDSSRYVELDIKNERTFSTEYASILRDAGVAFTSAMDKVVKLAGFVARGEPTMGQFRQFLNDHVPDIHELHVKRTNAHEERYFRPFAGFEANRSPSWWVAFSKLKHEEMDSYVDGNMVNCLVSASALLLLWRSMASGEVKSVLFQEIGYPQEGLAKYWKKTPATTTKNAGSKKKTSD
jgi:hypothetical protein